MPTYSLYSLSPTLYSLSLLKHEMRHTYRQILVSLASVSLTSHHSPHSHISLSHSLLSFSSHTLNIFSPNDDSGDDMYS